MCFLYLSPPHQRKQPHHSQHNKHMYMTSLQVLCVRCKHTICHTRSLNSKFPWYMLKTPFATNSIPSYDVLTVRAVFVWRACFVGAPRRYGSRGLETWCRLFLARHSLSLHHWRAVICLWRRSFLVTSRERSWCVCKGSTCWGLHRVRGHFLAKLWFQ
jgi:hypothetical protein